MVKLQFIPASGGQQADQETRKLIRRHVMLGRNQGRRPKKPKPPTLPGTLILFRDENGSEGRSTPPELPHAIGTELSFIQFADHVNITLKHETLRFCLTMPENLFMLEPCIFFDPKDDEAVCLQPLICDPLYLNVMVFGAQVCIEQSFQQATSQIRNTKGGAGLQHYGKALKLLRDRLPDVNGDSMMFDAIIVAVFTLGMYALISQDFEVARNHALGLSKLVSMRKDGIMSFGSRPKQMMELLRCDLSVWLATGEAPFFFAQQNPGLSISPFGLLKPSARHQRPLFFADTELGEIWDHLGGFCVASNEAVVLREKLDIEQLLTTMAHAMYRLSYLSTRADSTDELLRLGMLSFCGKIFLQWPLLRLPFPWLQQKYGETIKRAMQNHGATTGPEMLLWLLIIYGFTYAPADRETTGQLQDWLKIVVERCGIANLNAVKQIMSTYLWIDAICDRALQNLFRDIDL